MARIPKNERIWVRETTEDGRTYYITSKEDDRSIYFLYEEVDGKAEKLGKSKSPRELEEKYVYIQKETIKRRGRPKKEVKEEVALW